jgi:outer membrane protein assembly factor BamB
MVTAAAGLLFGVGAAPAIGASTGSKQAAGISRLVSNYRAGIAQPRETTVGPHAVVVASAGLPTVPINSTATAAAIGGANWSSYLFTAGHNSYNAGATTITPANAAALTQAWTWLPGAPPVPALGRSLYSSPTVYDGVIYIGANNGTFYALSEATGTVIWKHFVGYVTTTVKGCGDHGFISTATVANDPVSGTLTVYVAGPDGYLYAFNAATGAIIWRSVVGIPSSTVPDYFNWSSPAVANGHVYIGISSHCDDPLVRGGLLSFDQSTGAQQAVFYTVPEGDVGGSVWSSPAVGGNGNVFITTGNGPASNPSLGGSISVISLNGTTLAETGAWQVPASQQPGVDSDFGGSPTLFSAVLPGSTKPTEMVGACNKNGRYYAFRRSDLPAGPVWQDVISMKSSCVAASPWDGSHLWLSSHTATPTPSGTISEVDPATGQVIWSTTLPGPIFGSPTLDGSGILAVPTGIKTTGATYLLDASNGTVLATLDNSGDFAQPVFAGPNVFVASITAGLIAFEVP